MKLLKKLLLRCFIVMPLFALVGCASFVDMAQHGFKTKEERIWGLWNCTIEIPSEYEGDIATKLVSENSYIRNGRFNSFGEMTLTLPHEDERIDVIYSLIATGVWEVLDNALISTIENMTFINESHPELEEALKITEMFPENITGSEEIMTLSETHFIVKGLHGTLQESARASNGDG